MCGIAGFIDKKNTGVSIEKIKEITDLVSHRGPNGEGFFCKDNFAFGHRRLSIIDLSRAGAQPMTYRNRYTITFNGEVYNYLEIKEELIKEGYDFNSHTDTEVILAAYDKWKENCFLKFNGMWSLAIYDEEINEIICSRDRFGVKPFYYSDTLDHFIFGSEIKQCLSSTPAKANIPIVMDYLALNITDHTDETFFSGIKTLRGGHLLRYKLNENKFDIKKYYTIKLNEEVRGNPYEINKVNFIKKFERSIKWRLRSDVTVGTCLSGGLDSSFIAAVAAKLHYEESSSKFKGITAEAIDEEINEIKYAKIVVEAVGLEWHVTKPTTEQFWGDIDIIIKTQEEPFGGPTVAMQNYVMKEAKKAGITVLLDGQGADETLLGYSRYISAMMGEMSFFGKIKFLRQASQKYGVSMRELIKIYYYFSSPRIKIKRAKYRLRKIDKKFLSYVNWNLIKDISLKYRNPTDLQIFEVITSQIPQLLKWEDKNSMAYSIETRLPFLDWNLVEFNLSLPIDHKVRNGWSKFIIRDSMNGLIPEEVAWRKKKFGFNAPLRSWLSDVGSLEKKVNGSEFIKTLFNGNKVVATDKLFLWRLYNLARWAELFKVTM